VTLAPPPEGRPGGPAGGRDHLQLRDQPVGHGVFRLRYELSVLADRLGVIDILALELPDLGPAA